MTQRDAQVTDMGPSIRQEVTLWRRASYILGRTHTPDVVAAGVGLDVVHAYDPTNRILHLGTGDRRSAASLDHTIRSVKEWGGDRLPAYLTAGPDGAMYVVDLGIQGDIVYRIDPDGTETPIAGGGDENVEGGPSVNAHFEHLQGIAVDGDGALYVSESLPEDKIYRIRNGRVETVAGGGKTDPTPQLERPQHQR